MAKDHTGLSNLVDTHLKKNGSEPDLFPNSHAPNLLKLRPIPGKRREVREENLELNEFKTEIPGFILNGLRFLLLQSGNMRAPKN